MGGPDLGLQHTRSKQEALLLEPIWYQGRLLMEPLDAGFVPLKISHAPTLPPRKYRFSPALYPVLAPPRRFHTQRFGLANVAF